MSEREVLFKSIINELCLCSVDEIITIREEWQQEMTNKKMSKRYCSVPTVTHDAYKSLEYLAT